MFAINAIINKHISIVIQTLYKRTGVYINQSDLSKLMYIYILIGDNNQFKQIDITALLSSLDIQVLINHHHVEKLGHYGYKINDVLYKELKHQVDSYILPRFDRPKFKKFLTDNQ